MDSTTENNKLSEIVDILRSWIPMRGEPGNMSRDFWMPDESCRVCYECDSSFTIFNRKHHCRLCGRVFCGRCTINTVPALPDEPKSGREDRDRIKVCNYCFKQWKQQVATGSNVVPSSPGLTPSPSSSSLVSTHSSCCTCNSGSSAGSTEFSTGPFQHVSCGVGRSPHSSAGMDSKSPKQDQARSSEKLDYLDSMDPFGHQLGSCSRSDDEDDDYPIHRSHSEINIVSPDMGYGTNNYYQIDHIYGPRETELNEESTHTTYNSSLVPENFETQGSLDYETRKEADIQTNDVQFGSAPLHVMDEADVEAVDYENNGLMWLPPEPEDEEDEREVFVSDDDDNDDPGEDATGEWGYLRSSSFIVGELRNRDRSNEEHRRAMKRVVDGHFTALISQLLQAENFPASDHESWLDIITQLSWEAATLLKPDTSRGGGMDPGGYVKVKCIACGNRSESMVIKGIVCKKNVAHRRMSSKIDKARLLLLGGALEYQRVANHLSSFDTLLQQEMDHLKMAVAKIDAHHPNILLVEKSVSRYAQEYLLAKNISLVLNIKRPLLERIARCSGAQIVPSIDSLSTPKLGYCDSFHVEKFLEDLGSAGQGGKKLTKTLMFFEGCPRPLGCTILLKGASGDELKKVKHVVHYGVFAAYHLALETSFLADEGASLPELPLKSPIKVALPDKPSSVDRSISMIPGYNSPSSEKPQAQQQPRNAFQSRNDLSLDSRRSSVLSMSEAESISFKGSTAQTPNAESRIRNLDHMVSAADLSGSQWEQLSDSPYSIDKNRPDANGCSDAKRLDYLERDTLYSKHLFETEALGQGFNFSPGDENRLPLNMDKSESVLSGQHDKDQTGELETLIDEFPPSPSDHQSILVSLSTRCVLKGSVCERAHLFRIKYYGNFDKPLGRFLRDHLFDQGSRCNSCEMPSEAHVHCYTHQQGSLTISVKKLQESFLPGEREGKIWMWHRCLRCPRTNGFPPATKRVVMSDAAWGLSFGKFLELSFSNHAAASRVASCGHSLHRDCLRFYGFGRMVACFRYAPINVYSVHLPPSMLEFNYYKEEWIQKEFDEVSSRAYVLFTEVQEVLHQISDGIKDDAGKKADESSKLIAELELMLQKEIKEFEESLWFVLKKEVKHVRPEMDILEINRTKRQLVFHAYVWDQRLMHLSKYKVSTLKEKPASVREKRSEVETVSRSSRGFTSWDSSFAVMMPYLMPNEGEDSRIVCPDEIHKGMDIDQPSRNKEDSNLYRSDTNLSNQSDIPEHGKTVRRARSEGQFPVMENTSDNLDTAWTGNQQPEHVYSEDKKTITPNTFIRESSGAFSTTTGPVVGRCRNDRSVGEETNHLRSGLPAKGPNDIENPRSWLSIPFLALYRSLFNKNTPTSLQKLGKIAEYNPVYITSFRELVHLGGARLLLPTAGCDIIVPIYDDEPTSVISYTLVSPEYQNFMAEEPDKQKNYLEPSSSFSLLDPVNLFSFSSFDESSSEAMKGLGSADESILSSGSRSFSGLDSLLYPNTSHSRISFTDDGPPGKVKYSVTCYFAKQFEALRKACCSSELDFVRSLSRCKKWGAQGGKSNVFFAKTLDDRFIIKQVTKTELESFIKFAPSYFKYLSESISVGCPTCLAKILGIYQVTSKHLKGGKETRMDVLVMENLLYRRNITRLYDLKGSARSRYNPDSSGSNKVLLDQNLIEAMPTSPIFLGTKAKRLLERAVWNDTSFLASIDVMDYSLLVGVDEEKHELVLGIIDFMRQYTWDKHLETWVKASGILGGPKNASPTIISPKQYKKRFRKAMSAYFLMVPDQWLSSTILPSSAHSDQHEENSQDKVTIQ